MFDRLAGQRAHIVFLEPNAALPYFSRKNKGQRWCTLA